MSLSSPARSRTSLLHQRPEINLFFTVLFSHALFLNTRSWFSQESFCDDNSHIWNASHPLLLSLKGVSPHLHQDPPDTSTTSYPAWKKTSSKVEPSSGRLFPAPISSKLSMLIPPRICGPSSGTFFSKNTLYLATSPLAAASILKKCTTMRKFFHWVLHMLARRHSLDRFRLRRWERNGYGSSKWTSSPFWFSPLRSWCCTHRRN